MTGAISKGNRVKIDLDEDAGGAPVELHEALEGGIIEHDGKADIIDADGDPRDKLPDRARKNSNGSVTLPLLYPQTLTLRKDGKVKEELYAELTFHRLRGEDQMAIANTSSERSAIVAFARSTRTRELVMEALFKKMDLADISDGGQVLNHFLTSGQKTGR